MELFVSIIIVPCSSYMKRQGASVDKLQVKAAKVLPLVDSPDPSKTQSIMGSFLY